MNINEIAKLAGVSRATVSRYLNQGYVSEDKKLRIQKVIDETGYQPSASAQTLRSKKTNIIGVIIPKINSDSISRMVSGISHVLSKQNYQLLLACTENTEARELEYLKLFRDNHVDGIILLGTIFTDEHLEAFTQLSVPIVILGQDLSGYSCVYHDDYEAAKELTAALIPTGTIFGYLGANPADIAVGKNRLEGFLCAMQEHAIPESAYHTRLCTFSMESGYEQARALLCDCPNTDTLICATDTIAVGALLYLQEQGIHIPDKLQIAGLNDSTLSHVTSPALTTVHFYYEEAGTEAAGILTRMIQEKNGGSAAVKSLKLHYRLQRNASTR